MSQVITGEGINLYRLLAMKAALKLEVLGMRNSRGSVAKLVKQEFGWKGSKQTLLTKLTEYIESLKQERENATA